MTKVLYSENDPLAFMPKAPSQHVNAQGPAVKPGEPLGVTTRTGLAPPETGPKSKEEPRVSPRTPPKK